MRRKLIKQGRSGLTIYLPQIWTKKHSLQAGNEVIAQDHPQGLLITPEHKPKASSKQIDITLPDLSYIREVIAAAYKAGHDEIQLNFEQTPSLQSINQIVNTFTGLEVLTHTQSKVIIKSFVQTDKQQAHNLFLKMFQTCNIMSETIEKEWEKTDLKELDSLIFNNLKKLRDHCLRIIQTCQYGADKAFGYYDLITRLELLSSYYHHLAQTVVHHNLPKTKRFTQLVGLTNKAYTAFLKSDFKQTNLLWQQSRESVKKEFSPNSIAHYTNEEHPLFCPHYYNIMLENRRIISRIMSLQV